MEDQIAQQSMVEFDRSGPTLTVNLLGEMDVATAPGITEQVQAELDGVQRLVLNVAEVTFCDRGGLHCLFTLHEAVSSDDGTVQIQDPTAMMRRLLDITGLVDLFPVLGKAPAER